MRRWNARQRALGLSLLVSSLFASSCSKQQQVAPATAPPSGVEWREARQALSQLRQTWRPSAGVMRLGVQLAHAPTGRVVRGRGALARRPPDALRMVLVGPGGLTALDFWARDDRWRFAVPAREIVVRGAGDRFEESQRGLPVSFLRWWLLRPLEGELVSVGRRAGQQELVVKDGAATLRIMPLVGGGLQVTRQKGSETEVVRASAPGCAKASYEHVQAGLRVQVTCESWEPGEARLDPRVFDEPQER